MSTKPHILLSNDDGISSPFLHILLEALLLEFRVSLVAPSEQQSWIGRCLSRHKAITLREHSEFPCKAWSLSGTPADCTNIALGHLLKDDPPELICAGINIGFNITVPLLLSSGTLAAAIEAINWKLPGIAFSHDIDPESYQQLRHNPKHLSEPLRESLSCAASHACKFTKNLLSTTQLTNPPAKQNAQQNPKQSPEQNAKQSPKQNASDAPIFPPVHNVNFPFPTQPNTAVVKTPPAAASLGSLFAAKQASKPSSPDNPSSPSKPSSPDNPSSPSKPSSPDNPSSPSKPSSPDKLPEARKPEDSIKVADTTFSFKPFRRPKAESGDAHCLEQGKISYSILDFSRWVEG